MIISVIDLMRCPTCLGPLNWHAYEQGAENSIATGVVYCTKCSDWYPIENDILELLPPKLAYQDDRARFWEQHEKHLATFGFVPLNGQRSQHSADCEDQKLQQRQFDQYAHDPHQTYTDAHNMPFWKCVDAQVFDSWRTLTKSDQLLLDIGCGDGRSLFQFLSCPMTLVGFDISKEQVREAHAKSRAEKKQANVCLFVGDAGMLPFKDSVFDFVLVYGVLHHIPSPARVCHEIARVLKNEGIYLGSENNDSSFRKIFDWLHKKVPLWIGDAGEEPLISTEMLQTWFRDDRIALKSRTHVFVPPHVVNMLGERWGSRFLRFTDAVGKSLPVLQNNGGLITFTAQKNARLADF